MRVFIYMFCAVFAVLWADRFHVGTVAAQQPAPILIGLDADMSSGTAEGGESIRRGALVAIRELNEDGGVLGRQLELVIRDHRGNPARGKDNIQEFASMDDVVAVLGGVHTPVALHELQEIHDTEMIYLSPWAAGTPIVDNGYNPNYVFRVSVRDAFAGGFMANYAIASGSNRLGLLFERTGWGRSNEIAVNMALSALGMNPVGLEWFNWGVPDLSKEIDRLIQDGAETIILVANPREGGIAVKSMASRPESDRIPIVSHWGISGGDFFVNNMGDLEKVNFSFLQTFSFLKPPMPDRADKFFESYQRSFPDTNRREDVQSPVGAAHAYDLIHLLAVAIADAETIERYAVREALEKISNYSGLMKDYAPPFTVERHDALTVDDFIMTRFDRDGVIRPVDMN